MTDEAAALAAFLYMAFVFMSVEALVVAKEDLVSWLGRRRADKPDKPKASLDGGTYRTLPRERKE